MKYVIWGAGSRGGRLFRHLKKEDVLAFVDKDRKKTGTFFYGKEVIGLETYMEKYRDAILVITHTFEENAIEELDRLGVKNFMRLSDCPGEFQEENTRPYLEDYIKSIVNPFDTYGIRGISVYGLEVYSWLSEIGNDHSYMIIDEDVPPELTASIRNHGCRAVAESEIVSKNIDTILNCKYVEETEITSAFMGIRQQNIHDCSDVIEEYYNPEIEKFKDIHKGESCFIVATGPSLKSADLDVLAENKVLAFGVNEIGHVYEATGWRPTYYVGIDRDLVESEYFRELKPQEQCEYAFVGDESEDFWQKEQKQTVLKQHLCSEWAFGRYPKFSEDLSRKSYTGGTIVYICIQLAVYMGFQNIYLLGTDFSGANEHGVKYRHFYEEKELVCVSYTNQVKAGYEKAKKYAEEHGINIYNATRGGALEVFPRVDFDTLFHG